MKSTTLICILFLIFSCGKKSDKQLVVVEQNTSVPPYDTVAVDSFSVGATSVDIVRKIKMSSLKFQDSLKQIKIKNEEERLLTKVKEEKLSAEKKAAQEMKVKADQEKAKEKLKMTTPKPDPIVNP